MIDRLVRSVRGIREGLSFHREHAAPRVGDVAPDFELRDVHGQGAVRLSDHAGRSPVALVFGSFT